MEINRPVAATILLIITALLVFLFAWPEYKHANSLDIALKEKQATYNSQAIYFGNITKVLADIERRKDILEKVESALPNEFTLAPIIYFFQKKGSETGLDVRSIVFSRSISSVSGVRATTAIVKEKEVKDIILTLDVLGNYQGLKNFLSSIEKSARIFEVKKISFVSSNPSSAVQGQAKTYNFKLEITTHSY